MEEEKDKNQSEPVQNAPSTTTQPVKENNAQSGRWQHWHRFVNWYKTDKKKSIPLTIFILIVLLAAIPFTRYQIAGLVLKKDFQIKVTDSTTSSPVSGALVVLGDKQVTTNGNGQAVLRHISVGNHTVLVSKKYYKQSTLKIMVPILKQKTLPDIAFTATGRQIKIVVADLVNGKKLPDVDLSVSGSHSKTDKNGSAIVVVPSGNSSVNATATYKGYNPLNAKVLVKNNTIYENDLKMTPAGKIYFLSKLSGKVDVVKTNLDGSGRQTVLPGTGNEDDQQTVLLASRDWKYMALLSRRAGDSATLYLIDANDDSLSTIEAGNDTFGLVGWAGHKFVYAVTKDSVSDWKAGKEALKSYNAESKTLLTLDQTQASGSTSINYFKETFGNQYLLNGDEVVYSKNWESGYASDDPDGNLSKKTDTLNLVNADGSGKKIIRSFKLGIVNLADITSSISMRPDKANSLYVEYFDGKNSNFFEYSDGKITPDNSLTSTTFYSGNYSTYLLSPSGNSTFWGEPRDGKNTLFIGNKDGGGGLQIATLSDYTQYGWFSDDYLLVSKDASQLFIMPKAGVKKDSEAIKITDYHKPAQTYPGYGGGYGGF